MPHLGAYNFSKFKTNVGSFKIILNTTNARINVIL